jgi:membrane protein implicated in regulation of membrane protease activity
MSWLEATYRNPLKRVVGLDKAWLAVGAILLAIALLAGERLGGFLLFTGEQLLATAPFILFAVLLVAYLKASGAEATIARAFEGRETRMIVFAALLGGRGDPLRRRPAGHGHAAVGGDGVLAVLAADRPAGAADHRRRVGLALRAGQDPGRGRHGAVRRLRHPGRDQGRLVF